LKNSYIYFRLYSEKIPNTMQTPEHELLEQYDIEIFIPSFFHLKKHQAKEYIYLFWFLFTRGEYRIIYLKEDDKIIHYTHLLPKFFKFPFMHSKDLEIGPAWTDERYRGKGIFTTVLSYLLTQFKERERVFYIFAHKDNLSSQKVIVNAGFTKWKIGYKTDILGIYKVENR